MLAVKELTRHYEALCEQVPLRPIRTRTHYRQAVRALNELLDAGAGDEYHPLADLVATLGELIGDYEDAHRLPEGSDPVGVLRFLMQQHERGDRRAEQPHKFADRADAVLIAPFPPAPRPCEQASDKPVEHLDRTIGEPGIEVDDRRDQRRAAPVEAIIGEQERRRNATFAHEPVSYTHLTLPTNREV
mgnify:CR=1 FL=1